MVNLGNRRYWRKKVNDLQNTIRELVIIAGIFLILDILLAVSLLVVIFMSFPSDAAQSATALSQAIYIGPATEVVISSEPPALTEKSETEPESESFAFTNEEADLLLKLAMAEAESEGIEGKVHVMQVVLNRIADSGFPDTIKSVIYEEDQFTPICDGRFKKAIPDEECYEALEIIEASTEDVTDGALYFTSEKEESTWHSRNLTYLYTLGNHKFYK